MTFDYFSKNRVTYILTKLKTILDSKAVPDDIKNGKLTIQKNGTNVQTFTANQSSNATANITVPTKTSDLTNDSGFITNAGVTGAKGNSETTYRTGNVNITAANIGLGNVGNFKAVSTVASQGLTDTEKANARTNIGAGTSNFSGAYADLTGKPTIPTVNNATLTIQKNGTNVQTFTANQASNATANITVPTKVSELTNDSGYTTNVGTITGIKMNGASKGTSGVVDLGTVITAHQDISGKANTADLGDGAYKNSGVYYGTCATAAATKDKVVSVSTDQKFTLKVGAVVHVKYTYTNSYSATADNKITLNVNSTGAKNIYYGTGYPTGTNTTAFGAANYIMSYMYNGTDWVWVGFSGENNTTYNFSGTTFYSGNGSTAEHNANNAIKNGHYYYNSNGPDTSLGASTGDGALYVQSHSDSWVGQIAQDYRNGALFVRGKNSGTWQNWQKVYDTAHKPTASDVGLGNVGNFKAVSTVASQGLTDTEKSNARANIGAGTGSGTITGIKMNGASKGTSGVVDLGTVITAHQDISGKADKSATVSTVAWDSTNKKITKTINGTTTDVVTAATILGNLTKSQVTTALGYTPPTSDTNTHRPIQVNGTEVLGNNTTALNLKAGTNVSLSESSGTVTIAATNTLDSAGSTDTSSKIFLIGTTSQKAYATTYSHDTAYVGTDGCLYSGGSKVLTAHQDISGKVSKSGDTMTGDLSLSREGTTANNYPARIYFKPKDTTTGQQYTNAYLAAYNDHASAANGTNIVLHSGGGMFLGSGESPASHYSAKGASYTGEDTFITADGTAHLQSNGNTIGNRVGFQINTSGYLIPEKADTATNGICGLGNSSYRVNDVYSRSFNELITGSGTAASDKGSGVSPRYFPAKWTFNIGRAPVNGDIITIKIPVAGHDYGVFVSINNGTNYHPVRFDYGTARLTTHYGSGNYITLVYTPDATVNNVYAAAGADARSNIKDCWTVINNYDSNTVPSAICTTAAGTAAKAASCSNYIPLTNSYIQVIIANTNTYAGAITMNINGQGAKPIYINGTASSSSNYDLTRGSYLVYYDGSKYYFRKDGKITTAGLVNTSNTAYALTDAKVTQTEFASEDDYYEILFSGTADDITRTEGVRKSKAFTYVPSKGSLQITREDSSDPRFSYVNKFIDITKSNNGVDNGVTIYASAGYFLDKNQNLTGTFENQFDPSGRIYTKLYVRNYDTNGYAVGHLDFGAWVDKNGDKGYLITDPKIFLVSLGASSFNSWTSLSNKISNCMPGATILGNKILFIETLILNINTTIDANTDLIKFSGIKMMNTNEHSYPIIRTGSGPYIGQIQFYNSGSDIYVKSRTQLTTGWCFTGASIVIMLA